MTKIVMIEEAILMCLFSKRQIESECFGWVIKRGYYFNFGAVFDHQNFEAFGCVRLVVYDNCSNHYWI